MCRYFCILFIEFMFKVKTLNDFANLFSPNDFKKNDEIISRYFKQDQKYYNCTRRDAPEKILKCAFSGVLNNFLP